MDEFEARNRFDSWEVLLDTFKYKMLILLLLFILLNLSLS